VTDGRGLGGEERREASGRGAVELRFAGSRSIAEKLILIFIFSLRSSMLYIPLLIYNIDKYTYLTTYIEMNAERLPTTLSSSSLVM
jgi:hypothetical protein